MIVYSLLKGFNFLANLLVSIIPVFETPAWIATQLPDVLTRVASFNHYLPVYESIAVIIGLILFTLSYKVVKVGLNFLHINLNS